jgi:hypothetical protein
MANILQKISAVVKKYMTYGEMTLADGTKLVISTEKPEVGSEVIVVTEAGEEKAPFGEHILSDGTVISVDDLGKIVEISSLEEEVSDEVSEEMVEETTEEVVEETPTVVEEAAAVIDAATPAEVTPEDAAVIAEEVVKLIEEKVAQVEAKVEEKFNEVIALMKEMGTSQMAFSEELDALKKSPAGTPVSQMEFNDKPVSNDPVQAKLEFIKSLRNKK